MAGDAKGEYRGLAYRNDAELQAWLARRPKEAALEAELPIIDPHHHFWDTPQLGREAKFREGFAQLAQLELSFESWQYHPQLPDAIDLARAFPDTMIILNHVGGVLGVGPYLGRRQEILAGWKKDIAEMAKCPNVYCKLGGIGMVSFGFDFHEREVPPPAEEPAAA